MTALSSQQHEAFSEELRGYAAALTDSGLPCQVFEPSAEVPVPALAVALGPDDRDRPRVLTVTIVPMGDEQATLKLIQFYVAMPFAADGAATAEVARALAIVNGFTAVGAFGVRDPEIFFRHMQVCAADEVLSPVVVAELASLIQHHQEHFSVYVEGVAEDEVSLVVLPQMLASA